MGPGLPSNYATDHFAGAQDCPKTMLLMFIMSVVVMLFYATDNLFWAQHMPQNLLQIIWDHYCPNCVCCAAPNVLLIVLHGPSTGPKYAALSLVWVCEIFFVICYV